MSRITTAYTGLDADLGDAVSHCAGPENRDFFYVIDVHSISSYIILL